MTAPASTYFVGLDLGPTGQFTALAVLHRTLLEAASPFRAAQYRYALRHLHRFQPGTGDPDISLLCGRSCKRKSSASCHGRDLTGVGCRVRDELMDNLRCRSNGWLVSVTLTTGHQPSQDGSAGFLVPKTELIISLQIVMQTHRLQISRGLEHAEVLVREMETFRLRPRLVGSEARTSHLGARGRMTFWCWQQHGRHGLERSPESVPYAAATISPPSKKRPQAAVQFPATSSFNAIPVYQISTLSMH